MGETKKPIFVETFSEKYYSIIIVHFPYDNVSLKTLL